MHSGNRVVPLALLQLRGTHHTTKQGGDAPPVRPGDVSLPPAQRYAFPEPPAGVLGDVGMAEWQFCKRQMEATGVISQVDHATLLGYCALYEKLVADKNKFTAAEFTQLRMYAGELGFTPSARERLRRAQD